MKEDYKDLSPSTNDGRVDIAVERVAHGSCCTCQACGRHYDDCECDSYKTENDTFIFEWPLGDRRVSLEIGKTTFGLYAKKTSEATAYAYGPITDLYNSLMKLATQEKESKPQNNNGEQTPPIKG